MAKLREAPDKHIDNSPITPSNITNIFDQGDARKSTPKDPLTERFSLAKKNGFSTMLLGCNFKGPNTCEETGIAKAHAEKSSEKLLQKLLIY